MSKVEFDDEFDEDLDDDEIEINWEDLDAVKDEIADDVDVLGFAPEFIKNDKPLMKYALQCNKIAFGYLSEKLKSDCDLAKFAVSDPEWGLVNLSYIGTDLLDETSKMIDIIQVFKEEKYYYDVDKFIADLIKVNGNKLDDTKISLFRDIYEKSLQIDNEGGYWEE